MKKQIQIRVLVALGAMSIALVAGRATAQVSFPTKALSLSFWMARAMDQCDPATLSVVGSDLPGGGCLQTNVTTDDSLTLKLARVRISKRGRLALFATGLTFGDIVRVRLQLRVTKAGQTVKHPSGTNQHVTFEDEVVDCPQSPDAFTARPSGTIAGSTDLGACLAPNNSLAFGNIEILNASLVNVTSGKVVAVTGFVNP